MSAPQPAEPTDEQRKAAAMRSAREKLARIRIPAQRRA